MCGSSQENARTYCYFSTDPSIDRFNFNRLLLTMIDYASPDVVTVVNVPKLCEDINKSFDFFGNIDVESLTLEKCQSFQELANNCAYWASSLQRKCVTNINLLNVYNQYQHFSHAFTRRINRLVQIEGAPPAPILVPSFSCASSELIQ
jgi:hypothetical protein